MNFWDEYLQLLGDIVKPAKTKFHNGHKMKTTMTREIISYTPQNKFVDLTVTSGGWTETLNPEP